MRAHHALLSSLLLTALFSPSSALASHGCTGTVAGLPPEPIEVHGDLLVLDGIDPRGRNGQLKLSAVYRQDPYSLGRSFAWSDAEGRYTLAVDVRGLATNDSITLSVWSPTCDETFSVRVVKKPGGQCVPQQIDTNEEAGICACDDCGDPFSPDAFTNSREARAAGVNLIDGTAITRLPLLAFSTRRLGVELNLFHHSLRPCAGELGESWSQTYDLGVIRQSATTGYVVTPDLRLFEISRTGTAPEDPTREIWSLPDGFFARLEHNSRLGRWLLARHQGTVFELLSAPTGLRGSLLSIRDPNGNNMRVERNSSGMTRALVTDLGQRVDFEYTEFGGGATIGGPGPLRLTAISDPLGLTRRFTYDNQGNLYTVSTPISEFADVAAGVLVKDETLADTRVNKPRVTTLSYGDGRHPHQITAITDERGAEPVSYVYNPQGKVAEKRVNGQPIHFTYELTPGGAFSGLDPLEPSNLFTQVTDRKGNVSIFELHGPAGGPIDGRGKFGLRRRLDFTARGLHQPPLRPDEPEHWEQRFLQNCDCLAPIEVSQTFRSDEVSDFDTHQMPVNYPTELFTYNDRRQVTGYEYRGFGENIRWEKTYDSFERFSRELTFTEPRAFDSSGLEAGLSFVHTYTYDQRGNRTSHQMPTVTRGVSSPQPRGESWTYNAQGQVTSHLDANNNLTVFEYFAGPSGGGDINTQGSFGGYLKSLTRGAPGSADPPPALTTHFKVNALGMVTARTDPNGFVYQTRYNDLGEVVAELEPEVTLAEGTKVRYERRFVYDGAGYRVLSRRSNFDFDGQALPNTFVDEAQAFDAVGNLLSRCVELDNDPAHDLVTRYLYDANDLLAVIVQPEGNRTFHLYDERNLRFKTFFGIAPSNSGDPLRGFPTDPRAASLAGTTHVGFTTATFDARANLTVVRDGRGHLTHHFYDFANRRLATRDPNGNGRTYTYDDAGNMVALAGGDLVTAGVPPLARSYFRYDEGGRRLLEVYDFNPKSDDSLAVDPTVATSSSFFTRFDAGSRVVERRDANGNPTSTTFDAADRPLAVVDALGNEQHFTYDNNSNLVTLEEIELPPAASGEPAEHHFTTFDYDELNRRLALHVRGRDNTLDHTTFFAYDSRNNLRLSLDAEGQTVFTSYDDQNRMVGSERFAADGTLLTHSEHGWDGNSRKSFDLARSEANNPTTDQRTIYQHDDFDRLVSTTYPDASDPAGSNDECRGPVDAVQLRYDENSNLTALLDQRGTVIVNTYDKADRLKRQEISSRECVPGVRLQKFEYDALNRVTAARNNYSQVVRVYDALSRLMAEGQRVRYDGKGFTKGWNDPVRLTNTFDRQSNRARVSVESGPIATVGQPDLEIDTSFDALNRTEGIRAEYFDRPLHDIARYEYIGPDRLFTKTLGHGAFLELGYDTKRRVTNHTWLAPDFEALLGLVGFSYAYDDVDNALFERFAHDGSRFDNFGYNARYEVTGVNYRSPAATDYRVDNPFYGSSFAYDDLFNRTEATFTNASGAGSVTGDEYSVNRANEYVTLTRTVGSQALGLPAPRHDAAGNMTRLTVRPAAGVERGKNVTANAVYDAFNQLFEIQAGGNRKHRILYDPFGRRIADLALDKRNVNTGGEVDVVLAGSRRFVWDGWTEIEERLVAPADLPDVVGSRLERVYVSGPRIDELLMTAVDGNHDGSVAGIPAQPANRAGGLDFEFYTLDNRMGSTAGLLSAGNPQGLLETYRYTVYGVPEILATSAPAGKRFSPDTNFTLFTGRRLDPETGLYFYRMRYYEAGMGRFVSRDPLGWWMALQPTGNAYSFVANRPSNYLDPRGEFLGPVGDFFERKYKEFQCEIKFLRCTLAIAVTGFTCPTTGGLSCAASAAGVITACGDFIADCGGGAVSSGTGQGDGCKCPPGMSDQECWDWQLRCSTPPPNPQCPEGQAWSYSQKKCVEPLTTGEDELPPPTPGTSPPWTSSSDSPQPFSTTASDCRSRLAHWTDGAELISSSFSAGSIGTASAISRSKLP